MDWGDHKERMRRYLRDPDANIWGDALLLNIFNDSQRWLQQRTLILEEVRGLRVPQFFNWSYLYDWEWSYFSNSEGRNYQALRYHQQTQKALCYRFEEAVDVDLQTSISDEGTHVTYPWEAFMPGITPGDMIPVWFPDNFDRAKLVAWDREPIEYLSKKELQSQDMSWITHSGKPQNYWRYDEIDNSFVIWPQISSPTWDDIEAPTPGDLNYVYTFSWEPDETYIASIGVGQEYTIYHTDETTEYIFDWEGEHLDGGDCLGKDAVAMRGQWLHEFGQPEVGLYGVVVHIAGDTDSRRVGGIIRRDGTLFEGKDYGIAKDAVSFEDNILLIFQAEPTKLEGNQDESDYPRYLTKYVEYETLARAYSVNNRGRIDSLRDYWIYRSAIGLEIVKRFMNKRKQDRDYRFVTPGAPGRRTHRHPRLPDEYPAI